ncbi:DUF4870 domain-containing protein [Microcella frigidaquae]|uniref:DUF4870 domain-containing protein n=1 Tax=Microcella frigidaquae TaxID=424758 RepID=A0A840X2D2_9MICO|nr:DUF4870 domain-containing protein [Microcella frigidaquae]MBB5616530.1 hypothetical protein [Microcella frigidaquae]NHN44859.1 DUF4870 domain-containing protein [Microcella frigidaquae]
MSDQPPMTPPPANPYASAPQPMSPGDEKLWATLVHIGGIFFGFIPALLGYLLLKDRGPFVRGHTATALNFQLTMLIASAIGVITSLIVIGVIILAAVSILILVFSIIAALAANRGEAYAYPLTITFLK